MLPVIGFVIAISLMLVLLTGVKIIQPWEQGLWIVLGSYKRKLNPGFNFVYPLVSNVVPIDLRTEVLDVPRQEVITKDNSPTNVDALIYIKVVGPEKCYFEVANYRQATLGLAQTTLRSIIGDMELDEVLYNRDAINTKLRDILDESTDAWGVKVEAVEIREVDPVGRVKAAMEEQTSAERMRRAAILRAEGSRQSNILEAEGKKQARILEAEGLRSARVLEAEGQRQARILEAQGESQTLRILSLGAAALDQKALAVLSVDALKRLGDSPSTKIVLPFEITGLIQNIAGTIQNLKSIAERKASEIPLLENQLSKSAMLGGLPTHKDIHGGLEQVEGEVRRTQEVEFTASSEPAQLPGAEDVDIPRRPVAAPRRAAPAPVAEPEAEESADRTESWEWPKVLHQFGKELPPEALPPNFREEAAAAATPEFDTDENPDVTQPRFEVGEPPDPKR